MVYFTVRANGSILNQIFHNLKLIKMCEYMPGIELTLTENARYAVTALKLLSQSKSVH